MPHFLLPFFVHYFVHFFHNQGDLVKLLTNEDPNQRPEAKELKSHPLIEDFRKAIHSETNNELA